VEYVYDNVVDRDENDFRYLNTNPFPQPYYIDYLNQPHVQSAIGAYVNYTESSLAVANAFGSTGDDDRLIGSVSSVEQLLSQNVSVTWYFGDADYICNWIGGQRVAENMNIAGFSNAGFTNITTSDGIVHGQVKAAGKFSFVRIYESGHLVPFFQPVVALEMVDRVLSGKDIATGKTTVTSKYATKGSKASTYMEGNATVQYEVLPEDVLYNVVTNLPVNGTDGTDKTSTGNVYTAGGGGGGGGGARVKRNEGWGKRERYSRMKARKIQLERRADRLRKRDGEVQGVWKLI
jgi:hypothetical protein